ncbi:hypothetical protein BDV28DRAFT_145261 [Aspergillus coremiiformis]|uniref:Zn(2)-C6 fungal-type domain-containing protein n=1 Tax=Aspergillus coremiiformis TaxID=138285 RepID=A0A5N6ZFW8_9EURO|nr:hypothetical protein BDV28DRAFT_145261 [Aspergillus coremiiformis]
MRPKDDLKNYSSLACRQRKIKCDRRTLCSNCVKTEKPCSFIPPAREVGEPMEESNMFFEPEPNHGFENLASLRPSSQILPKLQEIYVDRADPMMKIMHLPTFWVALTDGLRRLRDLPKDLEAVVFAFYFAVIICSPPNFDKSKLRVNFQPNNPSSLFSVHDVRTKELSHRYPVCFIRRLHTPCMQNGTPSGWLNTWTLSIRNGNVTATLVVFGFGGPSHGGRAGDKTVSGPFLRRYQDASECRRQRPPPRHT